MNIIPQMKLFEESGFEPKAVKQKDGSIKIYVAPSASAYSKFLKNLMSCQEELNEMFTKMVLYMYENLGILERF